MDGSEVTGGSTSLVTRTFLFTDIEGSTALWEDEPECMQLALQRHNALMASVVARHGGWVFKTVGDAFCVSFDCAPDALRSAREMQQLLSAEQWPTRTPLRVRIALHTGSAYLSAGDYFGKTVNRCSRLLDVVRGGQTLLSSTTEGLVREALPPDASLNNLGMLRLRDLAQPLHVFQMIHDGVTPSLLNATKRRSGATQSASPSSPGDLYKLPTMPTILTRVLQALHDPTSDANAIQQIAAHDPAISGKLLQIANSEFFGFSRRVGTIAEAVQLLGGDSVQAMLLGVGAFALFRSEQLDLDAFWKHSIATALVARMLATKVGCSPEDAFIAGLLHDIGKLVFAVQAECGYRRALDLEREANLTGLEVERAMFEFTHPEVGQMVAERWNLPERYVSAIAHHHEPRAANGEPAFCALIGLADEAAHAAFPANSASDFREAHRKGLQEALGLTDADWAQAIGQLTQAQAALEAFVGGLQ